MSVNDNFFNSQPSLEGLNNDLQNLSVFLPTFFDSYKTSVEIHCFLNSKKSVKFTGKKLLVHLKKQIPRVHPFFRSSTLKFLKLCKVSGIRKAYRHTNVWTTPTGILQSFKMYQWQFFLQLKCGKHLYPVDAVETKNNIFNKNKFEESYLLNPPYSDYPEQLSDNFRQPLRNHLQHIFTTALKSAKPQVVILPNLTGTHWFDQWLQHPFVTPVFLERPLIFLRGSELILCGQAKFDTVLFIIGIFSPVNVYARNNELGQFMLKDKLFTAFEALLQLPKVQNKSRALTSFFLKSKLFCEKAHEIYTKHSVTYEQFPVVQEFSKYSMAVSFANQNQLLYAQQNERHEFYQKRLLKIQNQLQRSVYTIKNKPKILLKAKIQKDDCTFCGTTSHASQICVRAFAQNYNCLPSELKFRNFLRKQKPLKMKKQSCIPSLEVLSEISTRINDYAEKIQQRAPKLVYSEGVQFSRIRNHWPFHLALGKDTCEVFNTVFGYNLHSNLGFQDYPYIEILTAKKTPEENNLIYQEVTKLLSENKLHRLEEKEIHIIAPIFLIQSVNSVGKLKKRLIHDFSHFEEFFTSTPFKLPTPEQIQTKFHQKLLVTIDLKSAFYQVFLRYSNLIGFRVTNPINSQEEFYRSYGAPLRPPTVSIFV